jgi:hypothetical protein
MKLSLTAAHLFSISLSAVCLFSAAATARAQQAIDCTLPTTEPSGVVSENLAFCAIHHAQYLYFQRCPDLSNCPPEDASTVAAYKTASSLFNLYLRSRAEANPSPEPSKQQKANEAYWNGFLLERSQSYYFAFGFYENCLEIAQHASPPDSNNLKLCATGLTRIKCSLASDPSFCGFGGGSVDGATRTIAITRRYSFGGGVSKGHHTKALPQPQTQSTKVQIDLPVVQEMANIRSSITTEQREQLQRKIKADLLTITASQ